MKTLSSAHVHTQFCDGRSTAEEMVQAAIGNGFVSLGFSSHGAQDFDERYCMPKNAPYRAEVQRLKEKYADRITIHLGVERDVYCVLPPDDYEYYIASVHYLPNPTVEMGYSGVDGSPENAKQYVDSCCDGDGMTFARRYFEKLTRYVCEFKPPIVGHLDLVRKNNAALHLFDESSAAYRLLALDSMEAIRETGAMLEVNTGAIARGYLKTPYPDMFLLKRWHEMGGEIMLNSDCHNAAYIACCYDEAEEYMRAAGFTEAVRLGAGRELFEHYKL